MLLCFVDFLRTGISPAQRGFGLRLASQFPRIAQCLQRHPLQPFPLFAHSSELGLANLVKVCGETGIRTPETLLEFTRFPGVPLQPLEHLSFAQKRYISKSATKLLQKKHIRKK